MGHVASSKLEDGLQKRNTDKKDGFILDLSDLHYTSDLDEENEAYLLINDLKTVYFGNSDNKLRLKDIDYMVICGDLVENGAEEIAFTKALNFINIVSNKLKIPNERIIIVPGNHDLSWAVTMAAYHLAIGTPGVNDKTVTNVGSDIFYLKRNDSEWEKKFTNYSSFLYEKLYGIPYPTNPKEQIKVVTGDFIENTKIAFFMIDTSAKIDQFNREQTYFDTDSLIKAISGLPKDNIIKIVVGHHPLDITNNYGDDILFANVLQNAGFKIYLNGHLHRSISIDFVNPQNINPQMVMIGAGSLSVKVKGLWPGIGEMYNVIKISKVDESVTSDKIKVTVNTRQREYIGSYWQSAYIYYSESDKAMTNIYSNII
jgi:3',5'-cyclic AMP phosphodiesterase CpdA